MQTIPTTGIAQGIKYIEDFKLQNFEKNPVVICSLGDNSVTEGEVARKLFNLQHFINFPLSFFSR